MSMVVMPMWSWEKALASSCQQGADPPPLLSSFLPPSLLKIGSPYVAQVAL